MKTKIIQHILLIVFVATTAGFAQPGEFQVIVNADNPVTKLTRSQVSDMLLKKVTKWEDGQKVIAVDLQADAKIREAFSQAIHNKNVAAIKAYWQKKIFTGKGVPPVEKDNDSSVIEFVKNNPGAIGYVSSHANVSGVRVIDVTK